MNHYKGYTGLFRPPYNPSNPYGSTIYCVADANKQTLVLIPLTIGFLIDALRLIMLPQYQKIYIIPLKLDVLYLSDVFNLYQEILALRNKDVYILSSALPKMPTSDMFEASIAVGTTFEIHEELNGVNPLNLNIELIPNRQLAYRPADDIVIRDESETIRFCAYLSREKVDELLELMTSQHMEVHTSYANNLYGGITYDDAIAYKKEIQKILVVNSFNSITEYNYCTSHGVPIGKIRYNDFMGNG